LLEYENQDDSNLFLSKLEERIIKLGLNFDESLGKNEYTSFSSEQKSQLSKIVDSLKSIFKIDVTNSEVNLDSKNQVVKFHINSKEPKAVEVLLGRMFSTEFDIADEHFNITEEK
jgi:hypothetical protein